jgi:hypothetical protein
MSHDDEIPPGEARVFPMRWEDGSTGPMLWFVCPRGRPLCGVPLKPSPPNRKGCSWNWDGNTTTPTVTPSINCEPPGCGWHGFVTNGRVL